MSPSTWAVNAGVPAAGAKASATRPAGLALRPTAGGVLAGAGLGVGEGVISGNRPDAFPAPMTVVLVAFRYGIGPDGPAGGMAGKRLVAFPGPISVVVALFGRGSGGSFAPRPEVATRPAEPFGEELVTRLAEPFGEELAAGETDRVGLALGLCLPDAEPVGLTLGLGLPDAEPVGLALGVGCGDVEPVGLGVDVGVGDVEGAGLALAVDAGADVDGEGERDADVDGDGLGVLEALGPELVLAAAEEGEGEEVTTLASAGSCVLIDSPETRKAPVTRPATTARRCARDM